MDAIENPVKVRLQDEFNKIDVEGLIRSKVAEYEKNGKNMKFDLNFQH